MIEPIIALLMVFSAIWLAWMVSMSIIVNYELRFERIKVAVEKEKDERVQVERKLDEVLAWFEREYKIEIKPESVIERAFAPRS